MATPSPVAVRHPLAQRTLNTQYNSSSTSSAGQKLQSLSLKPSVGQKRTHSHITGDENVQSQILAAAFTTPPRQTRLALLKRPVPDTRLKPSIQLSHAQFKPPLPKNIETKRQRQETNDPRQEDDKELIEWRRSIKRLISSSTFYFDGMEDGFKEQAARWIARLGGVQPDVTHFLTIRKSSNSFPIQSISLLLRGNLRQIQSIILRNHSKRKRNPSRPISTLREKTTFLVR